MRARCRKTRGSRPVAIVRRAVAPPREDPPCPAECGAARRNRREMLQVIRAGARPRACARGDRNDLECRTHQRRMHTTSVAARLIAPMRCRIAYCGARAIGDIMRMLGLQELPGPTGEWPPVGPAYR